MSANDGGTEPPRPSDNGEPISNVINMSPRSARPLYTNISHLTSNQATASSEPQLPVEETSRVDDKDVRYLETKIEASEERGTLRLAAAMARIEGKLDSLSTGIGEVKSQGRDTRGLIIGSVFVILFGVLGLLVAMKQVWIGAVQIGQAIPHASDMTPQAVDKSKQP